MQKNVSGQTLSPFFARCTQMYFHVKWCVYQRKKSSGLKMAHISLCATYCAHMFPLFLHLKSMHINFQKFHVLPRFQNKNFHNINFFTKVINLCIAHFLRVAGSLSFCLSIPHPSFMNVYQAQRKKMRQKVDFIAVHLHASQMCSKIVSDTS